MNWFTKLWLALSRALKWDTEYDSEIRYIPLPPEAPKLPPPAPLPPNPPPMPTKTMLDTFCTAQRDFEGKPGDLNYRNNNPGNFRYSPVGYLAKYGHVGKDSNGFAIFSSYALGWEYLEASVHHTATLHPTWTIQQYVDHYAPPVDNNPNNARYAASLAAACGVPVETTLAKLFA